MRVVALAIWLCLAFLVVSFVGSVAFAGWRALRAWRAFRAASGRVSDGLAAVSASAESAERHAVGLAAGNERLAAAITRLQAALAELAVLRQAIGEARALLGALRGVVPAK
jgi:hypothetical protein